MNTARLAESNARRSRRWLAGFGLLIALGFTSLCVSVLFNARHDAWRTAHDSASNLARAVERDFAHNVDILDLSLQGVADALTIPGTRDLSPQLRQEIFFDRASVAKYLGAILVLDKNGKVVLDSSAPEPRVYNLAGQECFEVHRQRADAGLCVSRPFRSPIDGERSIAFSRRLSHPDGSFAGVVMATMHLSYFDDLFRLFDLGPHGTIALIRMNGVLIARQPPAADLIGKDLHDASVVQAVQRSPSGTVEGTAATDGQRRLFAYSRVGNLPLVISVGLALQDIYAPWRQRAETVAGMMLLLTAAASMLAVLLRRELLRRLAAEQAVRHHTAELQRWNEGLERRIAEAVQAQEATQGRLAQVQRVQALGQLAGGLAHDINNVLQTVSGAAGRIARRPGEPDAVGRLAAMITEAAERGASVTRRLLAFARRGELRAEPVAAAPLLAELREILGCTLGVGITLKVEAGEDLPPAFADKGQLETVLVNLATNARDAMEGNARGAMEGNARGAMEGGGTLTLAAQADTVPPGTPHPAGLAPGQYIRFTVADTGCGMDAATLSRVGEPFFTTKPVGKGTGLGLSMARGFAEQSGGGFSIASAPGRGTSVRLWFPQMGAASAAEEPTSGGRPREAAATPQQARILLVDDEKVLREIVAEDLAEQGYTVVQAEAAGPALARLDAGEAFDLMITDLAMPGLDGITLIQEAQKRCPALPAILLTGYAGEGVSLALSGALNGTYSLLRKPVRAAQLADRVAAMLENATAPGAPQVPQPSRPV